MARRKLKIKILNMKTKQRWSVRRFFPPPLESSPSLWVLLISKYPEYVFTRRSISGFSRKSLSFLYTFRGSAETLTILTAYINNYRPHLAWAIYRTKNTPVYYVCMTPWLQEFRQGFTIKSSTTTEHKSKRQIQKCLVNWRFCCTEY